MHSHNVCPCTHNTPSFTGHYVSLIKSRNQWLFFDDDTVDLINESTVAATFGSTQVGVLL